MVTPPRLTGRLDRQQALPGLDSSSCSLKLSQLLSQWITSPPVSFRHEQRLPQGVILLKLAPAGNRYEASEMHVINFRPWNMMACSSRIQPANQVAPMLAVQAVQAVQAVHSGCYEPDHKLQSLQPVLHPHLEQHILEPCDAPAKKINVGQPVKPAADEIDAPRQITETHTYIDTSFNNLS
jgi:hypothetical protein